MLRTRHAAVRAQQRAIPPLVIDMLERFGATAHQNGTEIRYFDKRAWQRAKAYTGGLLRDAHWSEAYLVVGRDEVLVTAGYRTKRIKDK